MVIMPKMLSLLTFAIWTVRIWYNGSYRNKLDLLMFENVKMILTLK